MTETKTQKRKLDAHTRGAALLLGPPGSGKTTLADAVKDHEDIAAVETGHLLKERLRTDEELSRRLKPSLDKGEMAPVNFVKSVLQDRLQDLSERHVLFDGFPRTEEQIEPFFSLLRDHALHLRSVAILSLNVEDAVERLSRRRVCSTCGEMFNTRADPPEQPGICDRCGGKLVRREDDEPAVVRKRFNVYERQTGPVLEFFNREYPRQIYKHPGTAPASAAAERVQRELTKP